MLLIRLFSFCERRKLGVSNSEISCTFEMVFVRRDLRLKTTIEPFRVGFDAWDVEM
jgi:hypothetical protein